MIRSATVVLLSVVAVTSAIAEDSVKIVSIDAPKETVRIGKSSSMSVPFSGRVYFYLGQNERWAALVNGRLEAAVRKGDLTLSNYADANLVQRIIGDKNLFPMGWLTFEEGACVAAQHIEVDVAKGFQTLSLFALADNVPGAADAGEQWLVASSKMFIFENENADFDFLTDINCFLQTYSLNAVDVEIEGKDRPCPGSLLKVAVDAGADASFVWRRGDVNGIFEPTPISKESTYIPDESDFEHWLSVSVYDATPKKVGAAKIWFSRLPVVYMDTDDGGAVASKTDYVGGHLRIQGNSEFKEQYNGAMQIKGRGNTSWAFPQKPYKFKLGAKTDCFGFGKNKHWVLIANYVDNSFMRNKNGSELAKELGIVGMDMTWVVGIVNGCYSGVYMFAEHIRPGKDRIDVFDWESEAEDVADALFDRVGMENGWTETDKAALEDLMVSDLSWMDEAGVVTYKGTKFSLPSLGLEKQYDLNKGFLYEMDGRHDEITTFQLDSGMWVNINKPEYALTCPRLLNQAKSMYQNVEDGYMAIDGYNKESVPRHYSELADIRSMAAYWLTMEILSNVDAAGYSRYSFINQNGLLEFGPVWDFDYGGGSIAIQGYGLRATYNHWAITDSAVPETQPGRNFWREWVDDPLFCLYAHSLYWEIARPWLVKQIEDGGRMGDWANYLLKAGNAYDDKYKAGNDRWSERWGFGDDYAQYLQFLRNRLEWLDVQFETLDTLVRSLRTPSSKFPYEKGDKLLPIEITQEGISGEISMESGIASVAIYINGLKYRELAITPGRFSIEVGVGDFSPAIGEKAIVQVLAYDSDAQVVARNYATLNVASPQPEVDVANAYIPTGNGENWDKDANWSLGRYPNGAGEVAVIGIPTEFKNDKGWRNIHINKNDVTIGHVEIENGGCTNRIDTGKSGSFVFCGDTNALGEVVSAATFVVKDVDNPGLAMIDLDESNVVLLRSDVEFVVSNEVGDVAWGGLLCKGMWAGNGHNLKKLGKGRMTIDFSCATGASVFDKIQVAEGTLAIARPIRAGALTQDGNCWVKGFCGSLTDVTNVAVVCMEKISVDGPCLFVPTFNGGKTFYGGFVAPKLPKVSKCKVYVRDDLGDVYFGKERWTACDEAEVSTVQLSDGWLTYSVAIPELETNPPLLIPSDVASVEVIAMSKSDAILKTVLMAPLDERGVRVVDSHLYADYFKLSATVGASDGEYVVSAELDPEKVDADASVSSLADSLSAVANVPLGESCSVDVVAKPGLYYSILSSAELDRTFSEGPRKLATGDSVSLQIPYAGARAGFYKIRVSAFEKRN